MRCITGTAVIVLLLVTACSGNKTDLATAARHSVAPPDHLLPVPSEIRKGISYEPTDRIKFGSEYEASPSSLVYQESTRAVLIPHWDPAGEPPAAEPAFAVYGFSLAGFDDVPMAAMSWYEPPADSCLWLGLADWQADTWAWFECPLIDSIELSSFELYTDQDGLILAMVLVLSTEDCRLSWLRLGGNVPPVAGLIADPSEGDGPLAVVLDASTSVDLDGEIDQYEWDWDGDGTYDHNSGDEPTAQHIYETAGTHHPVVRVTDNADETGTASTPITVPVTRGWVRTWGEADWENADDIAADSNGNVYLAGIANSFTESTYILLLVKFTPVGDFQWSKTWSSPGHNVGSVSLVIDSSDTLHIVGRIDTPVPGFDVFLLEYAQDGTLQGEKTWGGERIDTPRTALVDSSDNLYILGDTTSFSDNYGTDGFLIKYEDDSLAWQKGLRATDGDEILMCNDMVAKASTFYIVGLGLRAEQPNSGDALLLKFDGGTTASGKFWGEDDGEFLKAVALAGDGSIWATGMTGSFGAGKADVFVLRYDDSLTLLMQKTWGTEEGEDSYGIEIDGSTVFISGSANDTEPGNGEESLLLLSYRTSGGLNASQAWGSAGSLAYSLRSDGAGALLIGGIARNAYFNWQPISGAEYEISGIQEDMTCDVIDITGVESAITGVQDAPSGVINEGGGSFDALGMKYTP